MKVIVKEPNKPMEVKNIPNTLEALQGIVGGYIETFPSYFHDIDIVLNEHGRLDGLEPNIIVMGELLVGTVVFVAVQGEEFRGLTPEEIGWVKRTDGYIGSDIWEQVR